MHFMKKTIIVVCMTTLLAHSAQAVIFPPALIPAPTISPLMSTSETAKYVTAFEETVKTLTEAWEAGKKLLLTVGSFGPGLLFNVMGSLSSKKTSATVENSAATTDAQGKVTKPDLKNQKSVKGSAEKALTLENNTSHTVQDIQKVRGKIPQSRRDFAILAVATAWVLTVDAATVAKDQPDQAHEQITTTNASAPDLRGHVTTNNNINMRLTSNQNRLLTLTATRAALAGYNSLEKTGTLQNLVSGSSASGGGGGGLGAVGGLVGL